MIKAVLTIDDMPSENTPAMVDYLEEKGIRALMFAVGMHVEKYPGNVIYALQHGMIVGNHSYSHPYFNQISFEEGIAEIEKTEAILDDIYKKAGVERKYRPFRFPLSGRGGDNNERYQKYLRDKGFNKPDDRNIIYPWPKDKRLESATDTYWTFDLKDFLIRPDSSFTMADVFKRILDDDPPDGGVLLKEGTEHIILMHDHDETHAMVPGYYRMIIEHILENGVVFEPPRFI